MKLSKTRKGPKQYDGWEERSQISTEIKDERPLCEPEYGKRLISIICILLVSTELGSELVVEQWKWFPAVR